MDDKCHFTKSHGTDLDPILYNFLRPQFTGFRNKLECLSQASLSSLV
jgi:hypothetical protein